MESLERVHRANPLEPSRICNIDTGGTMYSRVDALASSEGMVGFALDALRAAYFSPRRRDGSCCSPTRRWCASRRGRWRRCMGISVLRPGAHDFEHVTYAAAEFDRRLGAPGLHRIGARVATVERTPLLPPGLAARFASDAFWPEGPNPHGVVAI